MKKNVYYLILCLLALSWQQMRAQGEETDTVVKHAPAEYLSGTLPVLWINTEDEAPIVDKENYIKGTYWLDANGFEQYSSIGSEEAPLPLQIRGRGNASWRLPKKPYRLKLDKKAELLGMPKSKHWVLMAAYSDWLAHGRNYIIYKISEKIGMPYTTRCVPCEVVLNGDYIGMYFLNEKIRIEKDRVNITEQADEETDSLAITGGWLLEIDNYREENQLRLTDKDNSELRITYHSPEVLSPEQYNYLSNLMENVNNAINTDDKTSTEWEKYINIDAMARFYVLNEVVDNQEAFSGSCWFYKDRGEDTKLTWGPFWDAGSCLGNRNYDPQYFFYEDQPNYAHNHWIQELAKFPRFQKAIRPHWEKYRDEVFPTMRAEVDAYKALVRKALAADYKRWNDLSATQLDYYTNKIINLLTYRREFLISKWDTPAAVTLNELMSTGTDENEYVISDNLAVVEATPADNRIFVTDGNNNWLQLLAGEYYDELVSCNSVGTLKGVFTGKDFIPALTLTDHPATGDATLTITPKSYDLTEDFNPAVNEVIKVTGIYNSTAGTLTTRDGDVALTLSTAWTPSWTVADGYKCTLGAVAQIKEPWALSPSPLKSYDLPYQNYIIYPLTIENATAVSNIHATGNAIVNVCDMQGRLLKQGVNENDATSGLTPGIYLVGNKKVIVK